MFYAGLDNIHWVQKEISAFSNAAIERINIAKTDTIDDKDRPFFREILRHIAGYAAALELDDLRFLINERFLPRFEDAEPITTNDLINIRTRLQDSLDGALANFSCLVLNKSEGELYLYGADKWNDVTAKWSYLTYDIREAGRCLAAGRSTATVFHCMRIIESGGQILLNRLGQSCCMGSPVEECKMDTVLRCIENQLKLLRHPTDGKKKDKQLVEQASNAYLSLINAKDAWRNPTMHPNTTWTPEEAKAIYSSTKRFMQELLAMF